MFLEIANPENRPKRVLDISNFSHLSVLRLRPKYHNRIQPDTGNISLIRPVLNRKIGRCSICHATYNKPGVTTWS